MFAVVVKPVQQLPPALPLVVFDLGGAVSFAGRDMSDAVLLGRARDVDEQLTAMRPGGPPRP